MIKVMVPWAPSFSALQPHLKSIDESRWYSNGGPLVQALEKRMGGVAVSSATLGLELASRVIFRKKRVRIPALTFVATATALLRAGFEPVLCDVAEDWAINGMDDQTLAVCPFGAPIEPGPLVDAAAAWGNFNRGNRVYSLHATKALSAGEGGMVCGSPELLGRILSLKNFGLEDGIAVYEGGTNAKMSEYHAAVGLASLDAWPVIYERRRALERYYIKRLNALPLELQPRPPGAYTTMPVLVDDPVRVETLLSRRGIQTKRWYVPTLDLHPAFAGLKREGSLKMAHLIASKLICLPFHLHLKEKDVDQIVDELELALLRKAA